jgi:membrane protease YdiL (CAAX protease family)
MLKSKEIRDVGIFALISFLYSWPIFFVVDAWLVPMYVRQQNLEAARLTLVFGHMLGMLGPALAALILWYGFRKGTRPALRWAKPKYYAWVVGVAVAFWVLPGLIGLAFGDKFESPIETHMWVMIGVMLVGGWISGSGEEIGWCAYVLPYLSPKIGKARAIMVSGVIRGLWHWPVLVGPIIAQVMVGEKTPGQLLAYSLLVALQLAFSNILFGALLGWIWYRTESMPLVGWVHQWYDLARDATILLLVGYGSTLWATTLNNFVLYGFAYWLLMRIGRQEGARVETLFKPAQDRALPTSDAQ